MREAQILCKETPVSPNSLWRISRLSFHCAILLMIQLKSPDRDASASDIDPAAEVDTQKFMKVQYHKRPSTSTRWTRWTSASGALLGYALPLSPFFDLLYFAFPPFSPDAPPIRDISTSEARHWAVCPHPLRSNVEPISGNDYSHSVADC